MKTSFLAYRRKMVAGFLPAHLTKVKRGQILTFKYPRERSRMTSGGTGTIPRLVFVLNQRVNPAGGGWLLHGLNLSHVPWIQFRKFIKRLVTQDTLTLIKRRYELKAPVNELIDRPKSFYTQYIKTYLGDYPCYRTYLIPLIKQPKVGALNYMTVFPPSNKIARAMLIDKAETLKDIKEEVRILNQVVDVNTMTLSDAKFKHLILTRFGSVENFVEAVVDIENYVEETTIPDAGGIEDEVDELLKENSTEETTTHEATKVEEIITHEATEVEETTTHEATDYSKYFKSEDKDEKDH